MFFENGPLFLKPKGIETRWASLENPKAEKGKAAQSRGGRKGAAWSPLKSGESYVLAEEKGTSGTIRRIWATICGEKDGIPIIERDNKKLRGLRLDFYWDGSKKPAVSAPFGDFFGTGLGRVAPFQSIFFTNPEGKSFNCYIPMPFKKEMKMVITNESDEDIPSLYYDVDYTIGDNHSDDVLYFHAHYCRENPTTFQKDYHILPKISGNGRYLGCNIGVRCNKELYFDAWWGEGEIKVYLDGDTTHPTLCGTGVEDLIGTAWCQDRFDNLFQGCQIADHEMMEYCFYRYHVLDPIYFSKDIRITIQQIGYWWDSCKGLFYYSDNPIYDREMKKIDFSKSKELPNPDDTSPKNRLFERQDDWSSCAYFYLDSPENELPEIDSVEKRIPEPSIAPRLDPYRKIRGQWRW